jgi:hypothetical protein
VLNAAAPDPSSFVAPFAEATARTRGDRYSAAAMALRIASLGSSSTGP